MTRIGFIGLGDMGGPMAARLLGCGHDVRLWNRTLSKLKPLTDQGAVAMPDPASVLETSEIVGLCLSSPAAVANIVNGDRGLAIAKRDGRRRVIIDCSTGSPDDARHHAAAVESKNVGWIDAPVSGGVPAATTGSLIMFLGGAESDIALARPFFESVASHTTRFGEVGAGQGVKLCNQTIVATNILAIAEAIALARHNQIDVEKLPLALKGGFADSAPLQIFGPRMAQHTFEPRLGAIELMAKDVRLALNLASQIGGRTPMLAQANELYSEALTAKNVSGADDLSALIRIFE